MSTDQATITIKTTETMKLAFLTMRGGYDQIPAAFARLYSWVSGHGFVPYGPAIGIYHNSPAATHEHDLRWEVATAVYADVPSFGPDETGIGLRTTGNMQVASLIYRGPYDQVGTAYDQLNRWVADKGYELIGPAQELYLNDANITSAEDLLTEIQMPITTETGRYISPESE